MARAVVVTQHVLRGVLRLRRVVLPHIVVVVGEGLASRGHVERGVSAELSPHLRLVLLIVDALLRDKQLQSRAILVLEDAGVVELRELQLRRALCELMQRIGHLPRPPAHTRAHQLLLLL